MGKNLIIVFISLLEWQPSRRWSGDFPGDGQHDIYAKEEWEKLGEIMKFSFSTENSRKLSHWNYQFINHQQSIEGIPSGLRFGTQSALKFVESVHCTANVKADYKISTMPEFSMSEHFHMKPTLPFFLFDKVNLSNKKFLKNPEIFATKLHLHIKNEASHASRKIEVWPSSSELN